MNGNTDPTASGETPVLAAIAFELVRVAQGHPTMMRLLDGTEVLLRLATPDEVMALQQEATRRVAASVPGWTPPPPMTRERASELVRPLPE